MVFQREPIDFCYNEDGIKPDVPFTLKPMQTWHEPASSHVCPCCKTLRKHSMFPEVHDTWWGVAQNELDSPEVKHWYSIYCYFCLDAIGKGMSKQEGMDVYKALYRICSMLNIYYSDPLAHEIFNEKKEYSDGTSVNDHIGFVTLYLKAVANHEVYKDRTFWNSNDFIMPEVLRRQYGADGDVDKMSSESRANRTQIMNIFHCDPFENDALEDREAMYADLATMIDDSMNDDLVRQKSAIEIVRAFKRIDKLSEAIRKLQVDSDTIIQNDKDLKLLIEQKGKESALVTQFSKDHGFADRYALAKTKGTGTLSAIVRDMQDFHYDPAATNRYDIQTSEAIRHISDISAESIFKQLQLNDTDYAAMVREQAQTIVELQNSVGRLKEELRLIKEKQLKQELLDELAVDLRAKGIAPDDVVAAIQSELHG